MARGRNADAQNDIDSPQRVQYTALNIKLPNPVAWALIALIFFGFVLTFVYGVAVMRYKLFPYSYISEFEEAARWSLDQAAGSNSWYYPSTDRTERVTFPAGAVLPDGLNLVTALGPDNCLSL